MGRPTQAAGTPRPSAFAFEQAHDKAVAANPAGLVFTLRTKGNRTVFHCGERIPIELVFENHTGANYNCLGFDALRGAIGRIDRFVTDPSDGAVEPEADTAAEHVTGFSGSWINQPVGPIPVVEETYLNSWLAIDQPGVYRLYDTTYRLTTAKYTDNLLTDPGTKPLVSNVVTITVLPHDPAWERKILQTAIAELNSDQSYRAFETIADLRNMDAGRTLLRMSEDRISVSDHMRWLCTGALADSPFRAALLQELKDDFQSPDVGITGNAVDAYATLAYYTFLDAQRRAGRTPVSDGMGNALFRQEASALLKSAVARKRSRARAISLATLAYQHNYTDKEPYTRELIDCFDLLPSHEQYALLIGSTPFSHEPNLGPALLRILARQPKIPTPQQNEARDMAVQRLMEFDAAQARRVILDEIVKKWPTVDPGVLTHIPGPKPNVDDILLRNFRAACTGNGDLSAQAFLVGRFGTEAIRKPVEDLYLQRKQGWEIIRSERMQHFMSLQPYREVLEPLLAFFYRVDPVFAEEQQAQMEVDFANEFTDIASVDLSPGLEKAIVKGLESSDFNVLYDCAFALSKYGRAEDEAALWTVIRRAVPGAGRPESDFTDMAAKALALAKAWIITDAEIAQLTKVSPGAASEFMALSGIHQIDVDSSDRTHDTDPSGWITGLWRIDNCSLDTKAELEAKLLLYPVGTKFTMAVDQKWWRAKIFAELSAFLKAHGMSLEETKEPGCGC
jgi:hypothetical protein